MTTRDKITQDDGEYSGDLIRTLHEIAGAGMDAAKEYLRERQQIAAEHKWPPDFDQDAYDEWLDECAAEDALAEWDEWTEEAYAAEQLERMQELEEQRIQDR